jgi:hypothetical protein
MITKKMLINVPLMSNAKMKPPRMVEVEVVDVDDEEHEAGPGSGELGLHGDRRGGERVRAVGSVGHDSIVEVIPAAVIGGSAGIRSAESTVAISYPAPMPTPRVLDTIER